MPAGTKILYFQTKITGLTGNSFQSNTQQRVKKDINNILYLPRVPEDAVKLAYVGSKELSPTRDLFIGDRSDSLYENRRAGSQIEFVSPTATVQLKSKNFIATQQFADADSEDLPLYFNTVLPKEIIPESVRIYDKDFNPVGEDKYKLSISYDRDEVTGETIAASGYNLFNSLENSYNDDTGEYDVYFLQYTIESGGTESVSTTIIDNELAYNPAEFSDFWYEDFYGQLKPWSHGYFFEPNNFNLRMPAISKTGIRYIESKRVSVAHPVALNDTSPWYPRIYNSAILSGFARKSYHYSIPEFSGQSFNPISPYKLGIRTKCEKITDRLVKIPHENIEYGDLFSYVSIIIEDSASQLLYAITNDPDLIGTDYFDMDGNRVLDEDKEAISWSQDNLLGLDRYSGICHFNIDIKDSYNIYASYNYKEDLYTLTSLNMNPIFDPSVKSETRAIYIVPKASYNQNQASQTESVKWLKISSAGKILGTNQTGSGKNEILSKEVSLKTSAGLNIEGVEGLHYSWRANTSSSSEQVISAEASISCPSTDSFPRTGWIRFIDKEGQLYRYTKYVSKTATSLTLSSDIDQIPTDTYSIVIEEDQTIEIVNFIDERTTQTSREVNDERLYSLDDSPVIFSRYFLLAELSINAPHNVEDSVLIDLRENGGGIKKDKYDEAKALNPEVQWYNDIGSYDGQLYPGRAVVVIKLPESLKERFSSEQISDIVNENLPFGIQPLIRFYGYRPEILSVLPGPPEGFGQASFSEHEFGE